ncbi:MAG: CocE/NonD family hydrolase [Bryobacteraceae bacterium]
MRVPAVRVEDVFVTARRSDRAIRAQVQVANYSGQTVNARVSIEVAPAASGPVLVSQRQDRRVAAGGGSFTFEPKLEAVRDWSPDDPYLYRVTVRVESAEATDTQSVRAGFRDFVFRDGYFRLNGKRIFLKGTHSVGHFPIGQHVPHDPELLRRELIYVKSMGFNTVRWLGRTMFPSQLDLCDELGLMVYEESYASWGWRNPPEMEMKRRFDSAVREMILRDRNHPSLTIWGLLNETVANAVHRHAVGMLPLVRSVDSTRMVLLSSGRWDGEWSIGSLSNPGSTEWTSSLGAEALGAAAVPQEHPGGYTKGAGDAHMYVPRPWREEDLQFFRTAGSGMKNVFLSEYGNGSQIDPIRIIRLMDQNGARHDFDDYKLYRGMYDQLERDWKRWGLDQIFASPSDMITAGQRMQSEQRLIALNAIRSNPHLAGYSLTGLSDQAIEGEGLMTTFRELKPGIVDAMTDGFAPVRWCLFAEPVHVYRGETVHLEAVLADEDVLKPGAYPARLKMVGPAGVVFERTTMLNIPDPHGSPEPPMVFPVFQENVKVDGPAGQYQVEVSFDRDAAAVGRQVVIVGDAANLPKVNANVSVLDHGGLTSWLAQHGARAGQSSGREVILVGSGESAGTDLMDRVKAGSVAVLLEPAALPEVLKGKIVNSAPLFWGRDDVVKPHPIFEGLPSQRLMDLRFYRDVIARSSITDFDSDAENIVPAFAVGRPGGPGYWAGSNLLSYRWGEGWVIISTLRLLENLGKDPAADRIMLNLVSFATKWLNQSKQTVMVPMRDGVRLATDVYRVKGGGRSPVLLMRTPYNKAAVQSTAEKYALAGYNVVVQDTRGRYESEGAFYPYNGEGQDGYDTLDWIQKQPWSEPRVGMWGASYVGAVQWQAVAEHAPGLAVLAPTATWSSFYRNVYLGGAVRLALISQAAAGLEPRPTGVAAREIDWPKMLLHLPLAEMDKTIGWPMPWLRGILTHPRPDGFWKRLDITDDVAHSDLPTQHVVGYYDFFCREVVANFQRTRTAAKQLILGPWDHGTIGKTEVGDVDFGANARFDLVSENLAWFDRFLKHKGGDFPRVRYFSMGDNTWREAAAWPPTNTNLTSFYLHSDAHANTRAGSGRLSTEVPRSEPADLFEADPADPVPAVPAMHGRKPFEAIWGPVDQGPTEDRKDVLVYSTVPLPRGIRFAGPLKADLAVGTDTPDADWVVKIVDVRPDGFTQNLAVGIQRSSFRQPGLKPAALVTGQHYRIEVDLGHAAARIATGHRLRVEVLGSCFPLYDRNTNTGEGPFSARTLVARQTVEHTAGAASRVLIPVVEDAR